MRTKSVLKNSIYSIISYLLLFILGVINRKVFLHFLNIEFLGFEGLFSNIFALLSLAELGVGTVITYSLYQEMASKNEKEIAKLMMIYKYMYRIIGVVATIIGFVLLPLLRYIVTDNVTNWSYIRVIFILQLIATVCTYFLSYRRVLYIVDQKQFICVKVDTAVSITSQVIKILVLIFLRNYTIYLLISIINNIVANSIISYKCNKDYPYAIKTIIKKEDFIKRNFFKDIKNFMIHKLSYIVYGGVYNIVISVFLGITSVGLVSNYILITSQIDKLLSKLIESMQASIGNLVYNEEKERGKALLFSLDLFFFFLGTFVSISYMVLFQPVIELWIGKEYLLPLSFVLLISVNFYIGWAHIIISMHRNAFGEYEKDRKHMILSAIVNLILSITLVNIWGVAGVMLGTAIGHLFIIYGRIRFVFKIYLKTNSMGYIVKHVGLMVLALLEGLLTYYLSGFISVTILGVLGKLILCIVVPNTINLLIFYRTKNFKIIKIYLNQIIKIVTN